LPGAKADKVEQIVVKEADLRRCGNDLKALRQVQLRQDSEHSTPRTEEPSHKFNMSFKSAFAERCRTDAELRDPWQGMQNPEFTREHYESDLVLNQVWVNTIRPPKKIDIFVQADGESKRGGGYSPTNAGSDVDDASALGSARLPNTARASSAGPSCMTRTASTASRRVALDRAMGRTSSMDRGMGQTSSDRPRMKRAEKERERERRRFARLTSRTKSTDGNKKQEKTPSRIQPLEDVLGPEEDSDVYVGSMAVRAATRAQRAGLRQLQNHSHYDAKPRAAWLSMNVYTGEMLFYKQAAAERLESAYKNGRANVPLAGLGKEIDSSIVFFSRNDDGTIVETGPRGSRREVQRIPVPGDMTDVRVLIMQRDGVWRFISDREAEAWREQASSEGMDPPRIEEKQLILMGVELVSPPDKLPPVNPNQRTYFLNQGFTEYW